jgi:hypothetical protein
MMNDTFSRKMRFTLFSPTNVAVSLPEPFIEPFTAFRELVLDKLSSQYALIKISHVSIAVFYDFTRDLIDAHCSISILLTRRKN